jgi:ankyrin repeat protein
MSPNDALFDAINRGDGAAARDAMNRGAQLDAKNVLGQTPIDAAIEANRNDITFLLLSMRGTAPSHGLHATQTAQGPNAATARDRHGRPIVQVKAQKERAHPVLSADRGTPNPAVGFTGF